MPPGLDELLAGEQPERAAVDPHLGRGRGAGATLAPGAVAVARGGRRLGELELHAAAQAAPGRGRGHDAILPHALVARAPRSHGPMPAVEISRRIARRKPVIEPAPPAVTWRPERDASHNPRPSASASAASSFMSLARPTTSARHAACSICWPMP